MAGKTYNDLAGVVVAGGESRRMGKNKALIPWNGKPLIGHVLDVLSDCFHEVLIVARNERDYRDFGVPVAGDRFQARATMVGLYSGLAAVAAPRAFFAACDTPLIRREVVDLVVSEIDPEAWAVVPVGPRGPEPLLAVYSKECLPVMETLIRGDEFRVAALFGAVPTRFIAVERLRQVDPDLGCLINLNTPGDLEGVTDHA